jgi:serine/threonine protein kinase
MLDPGMCIVGERELPFFARRPPLFAVGSQKATSVTGTMLSPTVAALAATRPPPGFVFAGPRSFFLSSFNGRCRYDSDAAFNISVADPMCVAKGTLLETLAACDKLPDCAAVTYYPVKDGPFAGGIGRFIATLEPAFQALPGVGFLKYGPAAAECASMSPYSVLYTRKGGHPSAAAAGAGAKARPWLENLGTRIGAAVGIAAVAALLAGLGAWGVLRWRARKAAAPTAVATGGAGPSLGPSKAGERAASTASTSTWPASLNPSAFAAFARSLSEGARSRRWGRAVYFKGKRAADVEGGGGDGAGPAVARRRAAFAAGGGQVSLDKLMADLLVLRSLKAPALARTPPSGAAAAAAAAASRATSAPGPPPSSCWQQQPPTPTPPLPADDWELDPAQVSIARRPDGTDWLLGAGAAAHVYRGLLNGVQDVAIKVWLEDSSGCDDGGEHGEHGAPSADATLKREARREDLRRETAILRSLRDRNVVAFVGACLRDACSVLVTEYCPRGDLYRALAADARAGWAASVGGSGDQVTTPTAVATLTGSISVRSGGAASGSGRRFTWVPGYTAAARGGVRRRAGTGLNWAIAADIARGLAYLHDRRIVHLDVKSANVLLDATWTAKLGDVGLSRSLRPESSRVGTLNAALGTLAWAAPEVLMGGKAVGVAADIYSLGAVLWELSTAETPPDNRCLRAVVVPDDAPAGVAGVIDRCLDADPAARPTAPELVEFFEAGLAALDTAAGVKGAGRAATTALSSVVGRGASGGGGGSRSASGGGGDDAMSAALAEGRAARLARGSEGGL